MSATRTPRTWGENVWPTAPQLADWLAICTENERLIHAEIAIRDAQGHEDCMVRRCGRVTKDALRATLAEHLYNGCTNPACDPGSDPEVCVRRPFLNHLADVLAETGGAA